MSPLAARAARIRSIRRRVTAATLAAFALAWGVVSFNGSMSEATTTTNTAQASTSTTATDTPSSTDSTTSSAGDGSTLSTGQS